MTEKEMIKLIRRVKKVMIKSTKKIDFIFDYETTDSNAYAEWEYYRGFNGCKITFFMKKLECQTDERILYCIIHEFVHEIFKSPWEYYDTEHNDRKSNYFFNLMEKSVDEISLLLLPLFLRYLE